MLKGKIPSKMLSEDCLCNCVQALLSLRSTDPSIPAKGSKSDVPDQSGRGSLLSEEATIYSQDEVRTGTESGG